MKNLTFALWTALLLAPLASLRAADPPAGPATTRQREADDAFSKSGTSEKAALDALFVAGAKAWGGRGFEAARVEFRHAMAMPTAPPHFRSYAHLRIAQSYAAEKNSAMAKAEYAKIIGETSYPEIHREEARECLAELERKGKGLPPRDPAASRTKVPPIPSFAAEFFLAPDGSDANPGTRQQPFATLEKARDAIRAHKSTGLTGPVAVRLLPGEYPRTATFALTQADSGSAASPIVYRADKPGTAVLYGGKRLSGFAPVTDAVALERLPAELRGKVFQCALRQQGVVDLAPLQERGYGKPAPKATLEVFFNGEALTLARWPNSGFVNGGKIIEPGSKREGKPSVFEYLDDRHARWTKAEEAWLFGYFAHGWADRTLKITRIDPDSKRVTCGPYEQGGKSMEPVKWFNKGRIKYHVFNLLEELDQPGEWYLNRETGILYFYPPSDPARATVEIGLLAAPMLSMADVSDVRLEGLVFDLSRANGLSIQNGERCLVAGCTVKRFAGNGITITGGRENGILSCDLYSLGRRATEVSGGDRKTLTPAKHFVENCWMHSFGRLDHTYVPAVQLEGCGNRVAHNLMGDCPSSVIRFEGNDHVLEYNRVYRALLETEDQGAMETFGNPTYRGVVMRHNHFSDIGPRDPMVGPAGRAAIRLDDAISGMLIYGNLFHRAAQGFGGININGGRDNLIDNNLFAECEKGITGGYNARNDWWQRVNTSPAFTVSELYLRRYPDLRRLGTEPGLSSAWRNVFWKCGPVFSTYGKPSADKFDLLANAEYPDEDPGFVDAAKGDFRLRPDAPLFTRIGFRPIPVEEIGLYQDQHRASWPVDRPAVSLHDRSGQPEVEPVSAPATPASLATATKPWTLGERAGGQCLITPEGKPFLMFGLSHVGGALGGLNGAEREKRLVEIEKQLRDWGFNTVPSPEFGDRFPFIVPLDRLVGAGESRYEDVFDPDFKARLRKKIVAACAKTKNNPNCIGYWWTDIPPWPLSSKKKFGRNWVEFIRDLPDTAPGKQRHTEFLAAPGPHDDPAFLRLIARELYADSAKIFRELDPQRLIFGERYDTFNVPKEILEEAAKVVDVISVQPYESKLGEAKYDEWHQLTGKPMVISDWNISFPTPEHAVTMWPQFKTPAEAATAYEAYLRAAFAKPYILGYFKCQYVDQVLSTGMLKQGLLDREGKICEEFVRRLQEAHRRLSEQFEREGRATAAHEE